MQNTQTTCNGLVTLQLATTLRYLRFVFSQTLNKNSACWSLAKPNHLKSLEFLRIHVYYLIARTKERQPKRIYNNISCVDENQRKIKFEGNENIVIINILEFE